MFLIPALCCWQNARILCLRVCSTLECFAKGTGIRAITSQALRNDRHLHNYIKIILRCDRFSKVMNIVIVVFFLIAPESVFLCGGKRIQESSPENVQVDFEHVIVPWVKNEYNLNNHVNFIRGDVLCWSDLNFSDASQSGGFIHHYVNHHADESSCQIESVSCCVTRLR